MGLAEDICEYNKNEKNIIIKEIEKLLATCREEYNRIKLEAWLKSDKHLVTGLKLEKLAIDIMDAKAGSYSSNYYLETVRNYLIKLRDELRADKEIQEGTQASFTYTKTERIDELVDTISAWRRENEILMDTIVALNRIGKTNE